jgi:hypothetical protein
MTTMNRTALCFAALVVTLVGRLSPARAAVADEVKTFELELHKTLTPKDTKQPPNPVALIKAYREAVALHGGADRVSAGGATGAVDAAEEAVQILGQIVVDRASAQAYQLIKTKLEELLGCDAAGESSKGFTATCRLLVPLRIEDIANSREALLRALVADLVVAVEGTLEATLKQTVAAAKKQATVDGTKVPEWNAAIGPSFSSLLATSIVPLVARPKTVIDDGVVRALVDGLVTYATNEITTAKPGQKALAVGLTAYLQCLHPGEGQPGERVDPKKLLAACDIGANVDALTADDANVRPAAHAVAQALVSVATPTPTDGDPRARVVRAIDLVFQSGCMVTRDLTAATAPRFICDDPTTLTSVQDGLALLQPIAADAVMGETNALVAAAVHALQLVNANLAGDAKDDRTKETKRAFILIGGLLDYAATFTNKSDKDADLHDQRTKVLESLTRSMTDRTNRAGDTILSVGGALRLVAGRTWKADSRKTHAFWGPLSLPLGVAVTHLPSGKCPVGLHIQVDALDLGQYLSYDNQANVRKPDLEDALAPSVTIGVAAGTSVPFVAGLTGAYVPHAVVDPANPGTKGALSLGVTAGFAVPLLDFN